MEDLTNITFGDVRKELFASIQGVRAGTLSSDKALAIAALTKTMTDSLQVEINAAKVTAQLSGTTHDLGKTRRLGRRLIAEMPTDDEGKQNGTN